MTPLRAAALIIVIAAGAVVLAVSAFVIGVRSRNATTLRIARIIQRDVVNPRALRHAGREGSQWAVIRHVGRRTGRAYETPVGATAASDGFLVILPYGSGAQWVQNVRSAGAAVLAVNGQEHRVVSPELVAVDEISLSAADRVAARIFGIRHALKLHTAADTTGSRL